MWHSVYILRNQHGEQYVGHSDKLKIRLQQHNNGDVPATIDGRPWHIEWFCSFRTLIQAIRFEKYLKSGSGTMFRLSAKDGVHGNLNPKTACATAK